ncbi:unnamed protein product [Zymoseptoria tritici ST99CH_1A5]|uniref:Uncharacterized protein n=1 Tax=Zymoseptoria tritici ST99CH_1A5 TaxID=1276529 RepID=A0A1Y6M0Y5_ZYMTR|nr:unnamed protein product [Zymoseptoria tritici ST99CH_1A5]
MASTYDYKLAKPIIAKFFIDNSIENIAALTPTQLNNLYDQLAQYGKETADEAHCKALLLKWIRRNMPEYDTGYGGRFGAAKLIAESMAERHDASSMPVTKPPGGCRRVVIPTALQPGKNVDVTMADAYPRHKSGSIKLEEEETLDLSGTSAEKVKLRYPSKTKNFATHASEDGKLFAALRAVEKATSSRKQHEPANKKNIVSVPSPRHQSASNPTTMSSHAALHPSTTQPKHAEITHLRTWDSFHADGTQKNFPWDPLSSLARPSLPPPYATDEQQQEVHVTLQALRQVLNSAGDLFASAAYMTCLMEVSRAMTLVCGFVAARESSACRGQKQGVDGFGAAWDGEEVGVGGSGGETEGRDQEDVERDGQGGWEDDGDDEDEDEVVWEGEDEAVWEGEDEGEWEDED